MVWPNVFICGCKFEPPTVFQLLYFQCQWCVAGCRGLARWPCTVMLTGSPLPPLSAPETLIQTDVLCYSGCNRQMQSEPADSISLIPVQSQQHNGSTISQQRDYQECKR